MNGVPQKECIPISSSTWKCVTRKSESSVKGFYYILTFNLHLVLPGTYIYDLVTFVKFYLFVYPFVVYF